MNTDHEAGRRSLAATAWRVAAVLATLMAWPMAWPMASAQVATDAAAAAPALVLQPCRLKGVEHAARCGVLKRPLDPAAPAGTSFDLHVAVLPAVARHKKPDPVFFFAGGPGQSAIALAPSVQRLLGRFLNRRDIVLIDQRGTGRSAPLRCEAEPATVPLQDRNDPARQLAQLRACRQALSQLPHGDLRRYTTVLATADAEAVRLALGAPAINLVGGSYGTRAVLDYLRQFPGSVRRAVIDGVAPPDMVLPLAASTDAQAALDALLADCERDARCSRLYPRLRADWQALLASLPRDVRVQHPVTGREEALTLSRDGLASLVRQPLYAPALASVLPHAVTEARAGRFTPLMGLTTAMGSGGGGGGGGRGSRERRDGELAMGMHFSVVCAEDLPRGAQSADRPGPDFGDAMLRLYRDVCADWPAGEVPAAFYRVPVAPVPVLLLSGGADPATPPRHGTRVAQALGANARHLVLPQAGHGTLGLGCMRDVVFRFIDTDDAAAALAGLAAAPGGASDVGRDAGRDAACGQAMPRPPAFAPVAPRPDALPRPAGASR